MIPSKEIIYDSGKKLININHTLECFVFTPPKTGSMMNVKILNNFNFQTFSIVTNNKFELFANNLTHTHYYNSLPNYEHYKLICTIRNPYSRFVSMFKYTIGPDKKVLSTYNWREEFFDFLYDFINQYDPKKFLNQDMFEINPSCLGRKINYPIRIENIFEDYSSIPFIAESEYFKQGHLSRDLELKLNSTQTRFDYSLYKTPNNWQDFYDQSTADMVYVKYKNYFDFFRYEKDSWKK